MVSAVSSGGVAARERGLRLGLSRQPELAVVSAAVGLQLGLERGDVALYEAKRGRGRG